MPQFPAVFGTELTCRARFYVLVSSGIFIWRVEQFNIVAVPANMTGKFYDGDAYIVLHVRPSFRLGCPLFPLLLHVQRIECETVTNSYKNGHWRM